MPRALVILASALLLAYLVTELSIRFFPGDFFALLVTAFVALVINGWFCIRQGFTAPAARETKAANQTNKRQNNKRKSDQPKRASADRGNRERTKPAKPEGKVISEGEEGTVKWFNRSKGYGFIVRPNGDEIFVHQRSIEGGGQGRGSLRDGERVRFIVTENERGVQAEQVQSIKS